MLSLWIVRCTPRGFNISEMAAGDYEGRPYVWEASGAMVKHVVKFGGIGELDMLGIVTVQQI